MKVLIADDEPHICTLLKYLIQWEQLGLTLAGTFYGGDEVLSYLEHNTADILLCDIEMPGVNGLELMRELAVKAPELKVIVVSGFRNFEYVRTALQYADPFHHDSHVGTAATAGAASPVNLASAAGAGQPDLRIPFLARQISGAVRGLSRG